MSEGVRWCGSDYALDIHTFTTAPAAGPFCQDFSLISLSGVRELKLGLRIRIRTCIKKMSPSGSGLAGCFFSHVAHAGRHFTRNVLAPAIFDTYVICNGDPKNQWRRALQKILEIFFWRPICAIPRLKLSASSRLSALKVFFVGTTKKKRFFFFQFFFSWQPNQHFRF